jgi:threonine/homoserine/homoserine lactone efflux protein
LARRRLAALLVYAFGTGFSGALMPGPLLAVTVADAAANGFWAGPLLMVGHGLLELMVIAALAVGLGAALRKRYVFAALGLIGGGVLVWMGWGMLVSPGAGGVGFLDAGRGLAGGAPWRLGSAGREVARGLLISLSHPYWSLWWATLGMALVARARRDGAVGLGVLFVGHVGSDLVWYCLVALGVAYGRSFMSPLFYRWLVGACGAFLVVLAAYFVISGARELVNPRARQEQNE